MAESVPVADIEPSNQDIAGSQTPAAGKKKNKKQKSPKSAPNQSQEGTSNPEPPTTQKMESEANPTGGSDEAQGKSKKDKVQGQGQKPPADPNAPQKSKAQLKAERRAIQVGTSRISRNSSCTGYLTAINRLKWLLPVPPFCVC